MPRLERVGLFCCTAMDLTPQLRFIPDPTGSTKLSAKIPLKELANYSISLSSLTGGRASFTTKFASYELVPTDIQSKLIAEHEAELAKEAE